MYSSTKWNYFDTILAIILSTLLVTIGSLFFAILFELKFSQNDNLLSQDGKILLALLLLGIIIFITKIFNLPYINLILWVSVWTIFSLFFVISGVKINNEIYFYNFSLEIICSCLLSVLFLFPAVNLSIVKYGSNLWNFGFRKTKIEYFLSGIFYWIISLFIIAIWGWLIETLSLDFLLPPNSAKEVLKLAFENIFITIILVSIIVPICEEIFFRGFLINGLKKKFNIKYSLVISSIIFSFFHINIGSLFPTFILGICLGFIFIKSKSIYPSIFIHSMHNFLAVIISKFYL